MSGDYTALSLDLGRTMGWAFYKGGVMLKSGIVPLGHKDTHPADKFLRLRNWLNNWRKAGLNEIFYEEVPRFESAAYGKAYGGFLAEVQIFALLMGIRLAGIKPSAVKLGFGGKGNCTKQDMCAVAHKLGWIHGFKSTDIDHDECDAIAIGWVILLKRGVQPSMYKKETALLTPPAAA